MRWAGRLGSKGEKGWGEEGFEEELVFLQKRGKFRQIMNNWIQKWCIEDVLKICWVFSKGYLLVFESKQRASSIYSANRRSSGFVRRLSWPVERNCLTWHLGFTIPDAWGRCFWGIFEHLQFFQ